MPVKLLLIRLNSRARLVGQRACYREGKSAAVILLRIPEGENKFTLIVTQLVALLRVRSTGGQGRAERFSVSSRFERFKVHSWWHFQPSFSSPEAKNSENICLLGTSKSIIMKFAAAQRQVKATIGLTPSTQRRVCCR